MDNWQPSPLSWSFSRKTHFDDCKRFYFYDRFWGQDPVNRWKLYEMRCITTLKMLGGAVVHSVIAEALQAAREGRPMEAAQARKRVTDIMWSKYQESENRIWHKSNRPPGVKQSDITNLLEHYYGFPDVKAQAKQVRDNGLLCIDNLFRSDLWNSIVNGDKDRWREIDEDGFPKFDLDGITVYARTDFAFVGDEPTIIDWKTGWPGECNRMQLTVYALYAQSQWGWKPEETRLVAAYLQPEIRLERFTPTPQDIEETEAMIRSSFAAMLEFEPAYGPADISRFPIRDLPDHCKWCRFQGFCEGAKREDNQTPAPEPDWDV